MISGFARSASAPERSEERRPARARDEGRAVSAAVQNQPLDLEAAQPLKDHLLL